MGRGSYHQKGCLVFVDLDIHIHIVVSVVFDTGKEDAALVAMAATDDNVSEGAGGIMFLVCPVPFDKRKGFFFVFRSSDHQ